MAKKSIIVEELSKKYVIGSGRRGSIRESFDNLFKRPTKEEFWALKEVSFGVNEGEVIGIIGRNGAGKSTLLKILSQITYPTSGRVLLMGKVSSLLEVGTGFHPELTGRENVFLNGSILGMRRTEIKNRFDEIVDFSGVEKFIDTPVKHYSSGMYVRLAFAVAAHLNCEILLVDEVLSVGDYEFQKKCLGKMESISSSSGRTVLFVSHNMTALSSICNSGIILDHGMVSLKTSIHQAIKKYKFSAVTQKKNYSKSGLLKCVQVTNTEEHITIKFEWLSNARSPFIHVGFVIQNLYGQNITGFNNKMFTDSEKKSLNRSRVTRVKLLAPALRDGSYWLQIWIGDKKGDFLIDDVGFTFEVLGMKNQLNIEYKNIGEVIPVVKINNE